MKHLDRRNPNADIFVIPQQEGGVEDDNYFGSIGDATMQHVQSLSGSERQLWEELIHMRSGAIFRTSPSTDSNDPDPMHLRGKDLKDYLDRYEDKVSPGSLSAIKEAVEIEQKNREASEDALDKSELIPYSDWEQNPQYWGHVDLPSTPKDRFVFLGDTTQSFYDSFPTGHPDSKLINNIIQRCDREWCGSGDDIKYAAYLKQQISEADCKMHTKKYLYLMLDRLSAGEADPNEMVEKHLKMIDDFFGKKLREFTLKRSRTGIYNLLRKKEESWTKKFDEGQVVLNEVRQFGKILYDDKELRAQMTNVLWRQYEKLKIKFAPRLMVQGVDINRCSVQDLTKALHLTSHQARDLWFKRPFMTLHEETISKHLSEAKRHHTENSNVNKILDGLEKQLALAIKQKSMTPLTRARVKMNEWQQSNKLNFSSVEWSNLWNYYRVVKDSLVRVLRDGNEERLEENV